VSLSVARRHRGEPSLLKKCSTPLSWRKEVPGAERARTLQEKEMAWGLSCVKAWCRTTVWSGRIGNKAQKADRQRPKKGLYAADH
jgi:hypothetical protein